MNDNGDKITILVKEALVKNTSKKTKHITKKRRWRKLIIIGIIIFLIAGSIFCFRKDLTYTLAEWRFNSGDNAWAKELFVSIEEYNKSEEYIIKINYDDACDLM